MDRSNGGELPEEEFDEVDILLLLLLMFLMGSHENELSNKEGIEFMLPNKGDLGNETFEPDGEETLHSLVLLLVLLS